MPNVPSVNGNHLQPKQQRRTRTNRQELELNPDDPAAKAAQNGAFHREDTIELSAAAQEFLARQRRGQDQP